MQKISPTIKEPRKLPWTMRSRIKKTTELALEILALRQ